MNILEVKDLKIWDIRNDEVTVDRISFTVEQGKCLALVGESGSGKSMTVKSVNRIQAPWIITEGEIMFKGTNLLRLPEKNMRTVRGKSIFVIFQDAMGSFDGSMKIGAFVLEIAMSVMGIDKEKAFSLMIDSMSRVKLKQPEEIMQKYPHQLSGGMLQRVMIALALTVKPDLIIADEPTTGLDTITQYEVVEEFKHLVDESGSSMIFISHDLGIVRKLSDSVAVMQNGVIVEHGETERIFEHPENDYTKYLVHTRKALGDHYKALMGVH